MLFNSMSFLAFFSIVCIVYVVIPSKFREFFLLLASYFFYMNWNTKYALLLFASTILTWVCGILLSYCSSTKHKKTIVFICALLNLSILFFFKYYNFAIELINSTLHTRIHTMDILLPVGISFYIFQALGYTIDVYRGEIDAEKNIIRYALFVCFFSQLVAGPIERSKNMLGQLKKVSSLKRKDLLDFERIRDGLILMVWGFFMKLVIADRVAILVDNVFDNYADYGSIGLIIAAIGFAIQIYCDFGSYSIIAIGSAKVMGFQLMENFNTPYFSTSITDFWRRWHISLSSWFRDYLYIPLGGNRKGFIRKLLNNLITFTVSGLWHGANLTFVFWGFLHGIYLIIENCITKMRKSNKKEQMVIKVFNLILTFILVDFAWIFFRADTMNDAIGYIRCMFSNSLFLAGEDIYSFGLSAFEFNILLIALVILFLVDFIRYSKQLTIDKWLSAQNVIARIIIVTTMIVFVVVYGIYGPGFESKQFIYFQF